MIPILPATFVWESNRNDANSTRNVCWGWVTWTMPMLPATFVGGVSWTMPILPHNFYYTAQCFYDWSPIHPEWRILPRNVFTIPRDFLREREIAIFNHAMFLLYRAMFYEIDRHTQPGWFIFYVMFFYDTAQCFYERDPEWCILYAKFLWSSMSFLPRNVFTTHRNARQRVRECIFGRNGASGRTCFSRRLLCVPPFRRLRRAEAL